MASSSSSNEMESLFQCSHCENELNRESKSFPCLHSFCETCLNQEVKRKTNGIGHCPKCDEIGQLDKLNLSPILISYLKCQKFKTTEWKCDFCLEDQIESIATNWCENCLKFLCDSCDRFHKKFNKQHFVIELSGNGKEKVKKSIQIEKCKSHNKMEDSYCQRCNVCLCDTCYKNHLKDSGDCSSLLPISVKKEAFNKQESQIPKLLVEIGDFEKDLEEKNIKSRNYCEELKKQCDLKCEEFWQNCGDAIDKMREKTHEMCDELRQITKDQVEKWQKFLRETEKMLKKFEIWRLNLHHLSKKGSKEKDVVLGVDLVARNLESSLVELNQKIKEPLREMELRVGYSDLWQKFLENLETEKIGFGILDFVNSIEIESEWNLPESNTDRQIWSLVVSDEDHHLFLLDNWNGSIVELTESGEFVGELKLKGEKGEKFRPTEMFFDSSQILGVNCRKEWGREEYLIFLERKKFPCFLKIQKIIEKKETFYSFSVCKNQKEIFFCDSTKFQFDFYTEKGEFLKTIDTGVGMGGLWPRIRVDPSTGQIWGAKLGTCEIFSFDKKGTKIQSFKTEEEIWDFFINKLGQFFFCNWEGIFTFFPEKKLHKNLFKFQKKSQCEPSLFILREKMFVFLRIDGKYFIKIFKFLD